MDRYGSGEYIDVLLCSKQANPQGAPYLRFTHGGISGPPLYRLELTDRAGPVVISVEYRGISSSLEGNTSPLRLRPPTGTPGWPYLPPGRYRLTATLDAPRDRFDPVGWVGRLATSTVAFEVVAGPHRGFSPAEAVATLADLRSPDSATRLAAVARADLLWQKPGYAAVVGSVVGPAEAAQGRRGHTPDDAFLQLAVDDDWNDALSLAGPAAVEPLLAMDTSVRPAWYRRSVAELLPRTTPDPRPLAHLARLAGSGVYDDRYFALRALGRFGPAAVPVLVLIARDEQQDPTYRGMAIDALETTGTTETVGPVLIDALRSDNVGLQYTATGVAERTGCRAALPELQRLATVNLDPTTKPDHNGVTAALRAFVRLAARDDARSLLLTMTTARHSAVRGVTAFLLGAVGDRSDVPRLVRLLDDPEWYVRAQADNGLRGLAAKPEGVGFDADTRRESKLWSDWFAAHPPP